MMTTETIKATIAEFKEVMTKCEEEQGEVEIVIYFGEDENDFVHLVLVLDEISFTNETKLTIVSGFNMVNFDLSDATEAFYDDVKDEYTFIRGSKMIKFARLD